MTRLTLGIALPALAALFIAVACSSAPSTGPNGNTDFSMSGDAASAFDFALSGDLAQGASCGSPEAYCADSTKHCVTTWANAQKAGSWCQPGYTGSIYVSTAPCGAGYWGVALVSADFNPTGLYLFYKTDASGALASVGSYDPDQGDVTCVAGPANLGTTISSSGCTFANPIDCVDGVVQ